MKYENNIYPRPTSTVFIFAARFGIEYFVLLFHLAFFSFSAQPTNMSCFVCVKTKKLARDVEIRRDPFGLRRSCVPLSRCTGYPTRGLAKFPRLQGRVTGAAAPNHTRLRVSSFEKTCLLSEKILGKKRKSYIIFTKKKKKRFKIKNTRRKGFPRITSWGWCCSPRTP